MSHCKGQGSGEAGTSHRGRIPVSGLVVSGLVRPTKFMSSNAGFNLPDSLFEGDTNLISSPTAHLNWMVDPFLHAQPEMRICC